MSVFGLKIQYGIGDGDGEQSLQTFALALERFGDNISDFGKFVFPRVLELFETTVDEQFEARGQGPVAGAWEPLSEKYETWKEIHFPGKPLMERTGLLREALTAKDGPNSARDYSASMLNYGTVNVPYASYHQTGTEDGFLPARPLFDFGNDFDDKLRKAMQLGVVEAAREARVEVTE